MLALLTQSSLYSALLIFPLTLLLRYGPESRLGKPYAVSKWHKSLLPMLQFAVYIFLFAATSTLVTGNLNWIRETWWATLTVPDLTPNVGLWWYFFTEMFDHFRDFFLMTFTAFTTISTIPLTLKFQHDPLYASYLVIGTISIFKSYPTMADSGLFLTLISIFPEVWPCQGTGNSNFFYAATLVFGVANGAAFLDSVYAGLAVPTTFAGPEQYKSHTQCVSEAQKYEKGLYKGKTKNGQANNNGGGGEKSGRNWNGNNKSEATGSNGEPLRKDVKMASNEADKITSTPSGSAQHPTLISQPVETEAGPSVQAGVTEASPSATPTAGKKKKPKKKRDPPPPGETRAERKKRKKAERGARRQEKLRLKAQMRQQRSEAAQAKRRQAEREGGTNVSTRSKAQEGKASEPLMELADPAAATTNGVLTLDGQVALPQAQAVEGASKSTQPKKSDGAPMEGVASATDKDKSEKKKKKKQKDEVVAGNDAMEIDSAPAPVLAATDDNKPEKKSKKRKREAEDEGGREMVEDGETQESSRLSFKERARAEKKARKAAKAAKKAALASES
ncbi:hypothetical protein FRC17_002532 [Serendipita sp. 399]|nr:hypothetical protein FRC17_002532 [Serendipita sp. 399]